MSTGFGYQLFNAGTQKVIANVIPQITSNASRTGSAFSEHYHECFPRA
jgi:hypothetical protein